jgi:hypothetical protein
MKAPLLLCDGRNYWRLGVIYGIGEGGTSLDGMVFRYNGRLLSQYLLSVVF